MSPRKGLKCSPRSPVKKAGASPICGKKSPTKMTVPKQATSTPTKSAEKFIFEEETLDRSWAEIVEEEEMKKTRSVPNRRKPSSPKKSCTKPKFLRSLELTEAFYDGKRRSGRIKMRDECPNESAHVVGRCDRKRHLSGSSTMTVEDDEVLHLGESSHVKAVFPPKKTAKSNRVLEKASSESCENPSTISKKLHAKVPFDYKSVYTPKLGWCNDEAIIERRTKEIAKAKEKPVYWRYLAEIPKEQRDSNHPRTPNKYINYSRRSWDSQMRIWKRSLYIWGGEEISSSCDTSVCSESDCSVKELEDSSAVLEDVKVEYRSEPDVMASLLGHFDLDTRTTMNSISEESQSTLKGQTSDTLGPKDFSGGI